jgi:hypothetical protein
MSLISKNNTGAVQNNWAVSTCGKTNYLKYSIVEWGIDIIRRDKMHLSAAFFDFSENDL